eukprot:m.205084 g.205084  ORF g.205084 m.205084 type:complete len:62 (-) comp32905_c0_seq1:1106-1291(-)
MSSSPNTIKHPKTKNTHMYIRAGSKHTETTQYPMTTNQKKKQPTVFTELEYFAEFKRGLVF